MPIMRQTSIVFATAAVGLLAVLNTAQSDDGEVHYYLQQPASVSLASATVEIDDDSEQDYEALSPSDITYADDSSCGECSHGGGLDYLLVGRVGAGYFSVPGESLWGGNVGIDAIVPLTEKWSFLGTVNANQLVRGTQVAGSLGLFKMYDLDCGDRWSLSLVWDQFTDTRVSGLYVTQARFQLGYSLSECLQVGAVYTNPTNSDNDVPYTFTFAGTEFTEIGSASISRSLMGYVSARLRRGIQCAVIAGHRESPDMFVVATSLRVPLSDRFAAYASGGYSDRFGSWGGGLGLQILLGPSSSGCDSHCPSESYAIQTSPQSGVQQAAYVPGTPDDGSTLPEEPRFPFDELQGGDLGEVLTQPLVQQLLSRRVEDSLDDPVRDVMNQPWWLSNSTWGITDRNIFFGDPGNNAAFDVKWKGTNRRFGLQAFP